MTSAYLNRPLRSEAEACAQLLQNRQPDILFQGDGLARARWRHKGHAAFLRRQVRLLRMQGRDLIAEEIDWIREARRQHSKAIAAAQGYSLLIAQRDAMYALDWQRSRGEL